jgi:nucleoid-associated protein YgaU
VQLVTYTVRKDDTMEKIAKTELRDARLVGEIRALNPDVDPNRMPLGTVLKLPWIEGAAKPDKAVAASTTREHQIRSGDTLEAISQQYYGTAAHTKLLQEHNKIKDPRRLKPGKTLEIPPLPK